MKQPFRHFLPLFILTLTGAAVLAALAAWHIQNGRPEPCANAADDFLPKSASLNLSTPNRNSEVQFEEKRYELKLDDSVSRVEKELDDWLSSPLSAAAQLRAASMPIESASRERPPHVIRPQPIVPSP